MLVHKPLDVRKKKIMPAVKLGIRGRVIAIENMAKHRAFAFTVSLDEPDSLSCAEVIRCATGNMDIVSLLQKNMEMGDHIEVHGYRESGQIIIYNVIANAAQADDMPESISHEAAFAILAAERIIKRARKSSFDRFLDYSKSLFRKFERKFWGIPQSRYWSTYQ